MSFERLDKIISNASSVSRSDLKKLAKKGFVKLNGKTVSDLSVKVDSENSVIDLNGEKIDTRKNIYIMLNKPKGVVSASSSDGDITVVDILPDELKRNGLFPAGRLDKDTTGFVLITNDGEFAHNILAPSKHIKKTYIATLDGKCTEDKTEVFKAGMTLKDGTVFKPASVEVIDNEGMQVKIIICEGKYHQIKRMFKAVGLNVLELKRIKIGDLELDKTLKEGSAREITSFELEKIQKNNK